MGKDEFDEARCNMILECSDEFQEAFLKTVSEVRK